MNANPVRAMSEKSRFWSPAYLVVDRAATARMAARLMRKEVVFGHSYERWTAPSFSVCKSLVKFACGKDNELYRPYCRYLRNFCHLLTL